jgi:hypothetical protein
MIKSISKRLTSSNVFKSLLQNYTLSIDEENELENFHRQIGFNCDRQRFLCQCIILKHSNWVGIWKKLKTSGFGTLLWYQLYYGEIAGKTLYISRNDSELPAPF